MLYTYIPNDKNFIMLKNYFSRLVQNHSHKILRSTKILENVTDFFDFKTKFLEIHISGLHQGLEKIVKVFKNKYYYPNYVKEISKVINECELYNNCKNDHINNKIPFKITPPVYKTREKYVIDFW